MKPTSCIAGLTCRKRVPGKRYPGALQLLIAGCVLLAASGTGASLPQYPVGAYRPSAVTGWEVGDAASFVVRAEQKALQGTRRWPPVQLELVAVLGAERQVVAGILYRLKLKVRLDGGERDAEAFVWWQAWRRPEPYLLMGWNWK